MKHFLSLRLFVALILIVGGISQLSAQPSWTFHNTGMNHTILIQTGVVTIDGNPLASGDYIGVFYDSAGYTNCGGFVIWAGTSTAVSAWGAEAGLDNGFQAGEAFSWKVWRASDGVEIDMTATYNPGFPNQGTYSTNGMSGLLTLSGTSPVTGLSATGTQVDLMCNGECNGSIDLTVSGGTSPYTFAWSNGETTEDISGLCAGTYDVTVTDAAGGPAGGPFDWYYYNTGSNHTILIQTGVVTIDGSPIATGDVIGVFYDSAGTELCGGYVVWTGTQTAVSAWGAEPGSDNGFQSNEAMSVWKVWRAADGVTIDMTATFNPGFPNQGNYSTNGMSGLLSLTGTSPTGGGGGASTTASFTITEPALLTVTSVLSDYNGYNVSANGASDGSIDLTVSGGTSPYFYVWSNSASTEDVSGLSAGQYSVFVTDANLCVVSLDFTLTEPAAVNLLSGSGVVSDPGCANACDGSIDITVSGGDTPYTFAWSNGETTEDVSGLCAGNYDVTVTDAAGGPGGGNFSWTYTNTGSNHTLLIQPGVVTIDGNPISNNDVIGVFFDSAGTLVCGGYVPWAGGVTALSAWGAEAGIDNGFQSGESFTWKIWRASDGVVIDMTATFAFGPSTYLTNGMSGLATLTGTAPTGGGSGQTITLNFTVTDPAPIVINGAVTDVSCNGQSDGSIDITVSGGNPPYTYLWSDLSVSEDLSGLAAGTYDVTVTDNSGCTATASYMVNQSSALQITGTTSDVMCYGGSDGSVDISVSGGSVPYTFSWSNQAITEDISGLAAGTYDVTVSDLNNCAANASFTVSEATEITITGVVTDVTIAGGSDGAIDVSVSGGTGSYSYMWSTGSTTEDVSGLTGGNYSITVTDLNACTMSATFAVNEPSVSLLTGSGVTTDNLCFNDCNGTIDLTVSGGVTPYSFAWSNGATSEDLSGLCSGNYDVTITDGAGGGASQAFSWTYTNTGSNHTILIPTGVVTINGNPISVGDVIGVFFDSSGVEVCGGYTTWAGAQTALSAWGAEPGVDNGFQTGEAFAWKVYLAATGEVVDMTATYSAIPFPNQGTYTSNGMSGLASLTGTSAGGPGAQTLTLAFSISAPADIVINYSSNDVTCANAANGSIDVTVSGGVSPYSYAWSNGETTEDLSNLSGGTYYLTVTDANQCFDILTVLISEPLALSLTGTVTDNDCNGDMMGAIDITADGGTSPYSYAWSNNATDEDLSGLAGGTYTVVVTDANGCTISDTYTVSEPTALVVSENISDVTCSGVADGSISLFVSGGTTPYTYAWDNGATTPVIMNLGGGIYSVTVSDANGCTFTSSYTVSEPSALALSAVLSDYNGYNTSLNGATDGSIDLSVSGGTAPYSYSWSNGETTEDLSNLMAGTYDVTVYDANQCMATMSFTLTEPPFVSVLAATGQSTDVSCNGACDGSIDLSVSGGTSPYTFAWSNGASTEDVSGLCAGTYEVTVTDAAGGGSASPFTWTYTNTGSNHTILIQPGVVTIDGNALSIGDVIGVFFDSSGVSICGGYVEWMGANTAISAWGAESGVDNGFQTGEAFSWKVWRASDGAVIDMTATYGFGPSTYLTNGMTSLASLTGTGPTGTGGTSSQTVTVSFTISEPTALVVALTPVDVNCNGGMDGSVSSIVVGGVPPYSYLWDNSETNDMLTGVGAGNYSLTVTDANGCTASGSASVAEPPALVLSGTTMDVSCNGGNDGSIDLTVSGGTPQYTYSWSNSDQSEDVSGLMAGDYTVVVTDANGCTASMMFTINEPAQLSLSLAIGTEILCNGDQNGSIVSTVSGGTMSYAYSWNTQETTADLSGVGAGTYELTVVDANNCSAVASITLTEPVALSLAGSVTNVDCNGNTSGSIDITVSGGTGAYSYSWSNGANSQNVVGLGAGFYSVTITDINGCTISDSYTVIEPVALSLSASVTDVDCNGNANGTIDLSVVGGTMPYSYAWDNGSTNEDLSGLSGGTYMVTVTDGNGCSEIGTYTVAEPLALTYSAQITDVSCNGAADGAIDLSVSGGVAPYTIVWSDGSQTEDITNLSGGNYSATITDANACSVVYTATIFEPIPIAVVLATTDIACNGETNGAIDATISGGTMPYTFVWSNQEVTEDISGLGAGTYMITVTDANACVAEASATIIEPDPISASYVVSDYNGFSVSCPGSADGSIDLSVMGGTIPYSFTWSNGESTEDVTGLLSGDFYVTITDGANCTYVVGPITLTEPDAIQATGVVSDFNGYSVSCNGSTDGSIDLTVITCLQLYDVLWSNGETTEDISGLGAGNYNVTVSYVIGGGGGVVGQPFDWTYTNTGINHTIFVPDNIMVNGSSIAVGDYVGVFYDQGGTLACGGYFMYAGIPTAMTAWGAESASIDNGFQDGEAFTWKVYRSVDGAIIDMTPVYGTTFPNQGTYTTNGLSGLTSLSGTTSATSTQGDFTLSFTLTEPDALLLSATQVDNLCFGDQNGSIDVSVSGGIMPYTYSWSNGESSEDLSGLAAGTYDITVTDANGCQAMMSFTITEPALLEGSGMTTDVTCNGGNDGSIDVTIMGGAMPYSFQWSNNEVTEDLSGLTAGDYSVTITDANGCMITLMFTIFEPDVIAYNYSVVDVSCFGNNDGEISIVVTGGIPPYNYSWSNGANTADLSGLTAGTYIVTVVDGNNCGFTQSIDVMQPNDFGFSVNVTDLSCRNSGDGAIDLTPYGGTTPYTFMWANGATSEDLSNLNAAAYGVTVADANGCSASSLIFVNQPATLNASSSILAVSCYGLSDGAINMSTIGGTAPYTFNWSNGAVTEDLSGLTAGTYSVTITDDHGCTREKSFIVPQPAPLSLASSYSDVSCNGGSDGMIDLTLTGGVTPYLYSWSNGATSQDLTNIPAGTYDLTVSDFNGCQVMESFVISEPAAMNVTVFLSNWNGYNISTYGASDGYAFVIVNGGSFPFTYNWNDGGVGYARIFISAGDYTVTITDVNGCSEVVSFTMTQPPQYIPMSLSANVTSVGCANGNDGSIDLTVADGEIPYTFSWSNGAVSEDLNGLAAGTYSVTVTDNTGSTVVGSYVISEPTAIVLSETITNVSCNGGNDGSIDVAVSGGVSPYNYMWFNNSGNSGVSNLAAGTYSLDVIDANGCMATGSFVVTEPDPLTLSTLVTNPLCLIDGAIDLSVTGGTTPYSFAWSTGATNEDLAGLAGGTYGVTVTDFNACTATALVEVSDADLLQAISTVVDVNCFGGTDGSISLNTTGGVSPYTWAWDNNASSSDVYNLAAGTYMVTITDDNNCVVNYSIEVMEPAAAVSVSEAITHVSCSEGNNGAIDLTISGGTAPYSVSWSTGANSEDLSDLVAGTYDYTVTDANGCTENGSVTITEPDPIVMTYVATDALCYKSADGTIDITVSGGVSPYTYNWTNLETTEDISGLKAGLYRVEITDANGCVYLSDFIQILDPDPIVLQATVTGSIGCSGGSGEITVAVSGGTSPYYYNWSNQGTDAVITGLSGGIYSVTVVDENGCSAVTEATIYEPATFSNQMYSSDVSCYGYSDGTAAIVLNGGTYPYTFEWQDALGNVISTNENVYNLTAGMYYVTATDANGCTTSGSVLIDQPDPIVITLTTLTAGNNAVVFATVSGGTGPYTYLWSPNGVTFPFIKYIYVGDVLTLTVTDANGCTSDTTFTVGSTSSPVNNPSVAYEMQSYLDELTQKDVAIYPNPTKDGLINIRLTGFDLENTSVQIYDGYGRVIKSVDNNFKLNSSTIVNLANFATGLYFVRVADDEKVITKRIILSE